MKRIPVKTAHNYEVLVGAGASRTLAAELRTLLPSRRLLIVTDRHVAPFHLDSLLAALDGCECHPVILEPGEENKTMASVMSLLSALADAHFDREDAVIALGGGVVGDMAAFAASIYLRGIAFINLPTTLLAMVDSSVGGKTGVDFAGGKNLIGSFWQPRLVICDTGYLGTLPADIFADGCAEVIKYAFIGNPELLELLETHGIPCAGRAEDAELLDEIVSLCVAHKARIVSADEFDRGERALLNFGHTAGHAIESLSGYQISHGRAVAMGMCVMTAAAERAGICPSGVYPRLTALLTACGLPVEAPFPPGAIAAAASADKKRSGDQIVAVLPEALCRCIRYPLPLAGFARFLEGEAAR